MPSPLDSLKSLVNALRGTGTARDVRGRRFVAVIECILNQNARDAGAARFPAMNFELLRLCHEHDVGILQMPCPEIAALGFKRTRQPGQTIRDALDTEAGRQRCVQLAAETVGRIETYLAEGYRLIAILGGNPQSPGCAVHDGNAGLATNAGVFMQELQAELGRKGLKATFKGMRDHDPELLAQDLMWLRQRLTRTPGQEPQP